MTNLPNRLKTEVAGRVLRRAPDPLTPCGHYFATAGGDRGHAVFQTPSGKWFGGTPLVGLVGTFTDDFPDPESAAKALNELLTHDAPSGRERP